jgi:hypothetical protein
VHVDTADASNPSAALMPSGAPSRVRLDRVTILSVDGRMQPFFIEMAAKALRYSCQAIDFAAVKLLAPQPPRDMFPGLEFTPIPSLDGVGYSRFMIKELHRYVETDYCLVVQADGYVQNPRLWREDFLAYDFIGAPWPQTTASRHGADVTIHNLSERHRVGNGGFSLRSRRLLEACAGLPFEPLAQFPEDFIICRLCQPYLAGLGLRFAPLEVAEAFAVELPLRDGPVDLQRHFGFHGRHFNPERALLSLPAPHAGLTPADASP